MKIFGTISNVLTWFSVIASINAFSLGHDRTDLPTTDSSTEINTASNKVENLSDELKNDQEKDLTAQSSQRKNRMLGYFDHYEPQFLPPAVFIPMPFYNDYQPYEIEEEADNFENDLMSRANRHRPSSTKPTNYQNSPMFYIRLPPTPYMFVPGMGYVSQPPNFSPIPSLPVMRPQIPALAVSPFVNLPVNFISNGRPSNIYQYNTDFRQHYPAAFMPPRQTAPTIPRPQRPAYANKASYGDSKITNLKGPFNFNGRPQDIFILPNSINPMYTNSINPYLSLI